MSDRDREERDRGDDLDLCSHRRPPAANVAPGPDRVNALRRGYADLDRRGMHPSLGEVTLRELLATWAVHDLDHVSQIFAGMAGSHDAEVGPWKAYLGILLRRDDPAAVAG